MDFCLRCNAWHDGLGCPINAEIARLRAALDKEREVCDEARRLVGVPNPFDPKWNEDMRAWCDRYSARRAAEAKASACPLVGCGCDDPKQHETGSAAEAKEPPR